MRTVKRIGIFLICAMMLSGCANQTMGENAGRTTVVELQESTLDAPQKTEVVRGNIQVGTYYDAQIGPKVEQLKFPKAGIFGEYYVNVGDAVKAGDLLAVSESEEYKEAIEQQQKEVEKLTATYDYQRVSKENEIAIKEQELKDVYNRMKVLEYGTPEYTLACQEAGEYDLALKTLKLELEHLKETYELELPYYQTKLDELRQESVGNEIKAPYDGVIVALQEVNNGDAIGTGLYYVAVADTSVAYARVEYVSDSTLNQVVKTVLLKDGAEYETVPVPMKYSHYVELKNSGETMYSEFEIVNADSRIKHGDYGKLKLITEEKQNVLLLPETALQYSGGNYYAYKDVDGEQVRTMVKVGSKDGIRVEIIEGLEEGDLVYVQD